MHKEETENAIQLHTTLEYAKQVQYGQIWSVSNTRDQFLNHGKDDE